MRHYAERLASVLVVLTSGSAGRHCRIAEEKQESAIA
jgi:hypothetical protein